MSKFKVGDVVKRKDGKNFGDGNLFNTVREPNLYEKSESPNIIWVKSGWIGSDQVEPALESLKDWDAKVGDIFVYHAGNSHEPSGSPMVIVGYDDDDKAYQGKQVDSETVATLSTYPHCALVERDKEQHISDGGPQLYYDLPFQDWVTISDMVEYLSDKQWGKHSWIFKDILKACTRFGKKSGTDEAYDAKKIIYYGARLLMSVTDKATTRKYLQQLLDDKQFKEIEQ